MTGLHTNVLVRYLVQDDAAQSALATALIEQELSERAPGFVSVVALVECCWVLKRLYQASGAEIRSTVGDLLDIRQLVIEQRSLVAAALARLGPGSGAGDNADALIYEIAARSGCDRVVTFDRSAARLGMTVLR